MLRPFGVSSKRLIEPSTRTVHSSSCSFGPPPCRPTHPPTHPRTSVWKAGLFLLFLYTDDDDDEHDDDDDDEDDDVDDDDDDEDDASLVQAGQKTSLPIV